MPTPWKLIDPKDSVQLIGDVELSPASVRLLTYFYQPIIGVHAFSLYFLLQELAAQGENVSVSRLLNLLNVGIPDFYRARSRLEALGLLRVFEHESDVHQFIYEVAAPLTAQKFTADHILSALLIDRIGEQEYNNLLERYRSSEVVGQEFQERTQSFTDVFHFDLKKVDRYTQGLDDDTSATSTSLPAVDEGVIQQARQTFDFSFYLDGLSEHFVNRSSITEDVQKIISTYHLLYDINELDMQKLTLAAADLETGDVQPKKLTSEILTYVERQNLTLAQDAPDEDATSDDETSELGEEYSPDEIKIITHAEATPPGNYLEMIKNQKGGFVTSDERWTLTELMRSSKLQPGAINILMHYTLILQQSAVLDKRYVLKIANDWAQSDVRSAAQAVSKVKALYQEEREKRTERQRTRKNYGRPHKRQETLPEWAREDHKDESKPAAEEPIDSSVDEAFRKRLDALRKNKK